MLFPDHKKQAVDYYKGLNLEDPFERVQAEEDFRAERDEMLIKKWMKIAYAQGGVIAVQVVIIVILAIKITPFVEYITIGVDRSSGHEVFRKPIKELHVNPEELVLENRLEQVVKSMREVSSDKDVAERSIQYMYSYLAEGVKETIHKLYGSDEQSEAPWDRFFNNEKVIVQDVKLNRIENTQSFQVTWQEAVTLGDQAELVRYRGLISYEILEEEKTEINPDGIYVTDVKWEKE